MTGIETAIILVAFVIVAAAFAFAVLNVGFQSTQKAQDVMRAGMEQASSAIELDGGVIAYKNESATSEVVANLTFTIKLSPGKSPISLDDQYFAIAVTTDEYYWPNVYDNDTYADQNTIKCKAPVGGVGACIYPVIDGGASGYLEQGDKFLVIVAFDEGVAPSTSDTITVELKPSIGNVLTVQRMTPLTLTDVMYLG